ncbi:hypothetical protein WS66_31255 [Burkholderia sp. LA-2-3-30-S1-D2]|nr:hypothetical protein WS66_31255 [Burkholderia sp. LA-2-3-30-S1-D2]KVE16874.1 hypothetical protein WS66_05330 [Burkholderia sp. LA-2-3-30-S1-D2]
MCAGMSSPDVNAIGGGPETGAAVRGVLRRTRSGESSHSLPALRVTAVARPATHGVVHFRRATGTTPDTGMSRLSPFETYPYVAACVSDAASANAAAATARHAVFMLM